MLSPDILPTSHNTVVCGNPRLSLEMLEERRRETQSIRQLWNNLQSHKHRLRQHHHFLSRVSSARVNRRDIAPSVFTRFTESAPPVYYGVSRSKKNTDASDSAEIPIKTAISKRPPKQQNIDRYNALTQKLIIRLPNVYDRPIGLPSYSSRDIREWKNEVTKVVPKRTPIYTTTASDPRDMTLILPPESKSTKDSLCYFQPVSPRRKGRGKDYVVNPEWPSEDVTPRSVRDRAHCVYNWPL